DTDLVEESYKRGIAGLWVSNHGGRALDDTPATITVLPKVADAVAGRMKIVADSGFRRGQDVFKALAMGADAVAIGRPILWGLSLGGWRGVQATLERIKAEMEMTMRLMGVRTIDEISREHLFRA
ncbi:MAG TPA: alpha-hydroxy acid oxidase, partial [Sphingobium sp.]|nr:alpha-hydroxy acid oxidase [Sphingobium sp.]